MLFEYFFFAPWPFDGAGAARAVVADAFRESATVACGDTTAAVVPTPRVGGDGGFRSKEDADEVDDEVGQVFEQLKEEVQSLEELTEINEEN